MRKLYISLLALLFVFSAKAQQTILIDPAGDGGFENGTTFPANGWTLVNGATNQWFVGAVAPPSAGTNAAYISDNATGTTYNYNTGATGTVYFYRDITFPAGQTNILLSFKWKVQGEASYDYIAVWSAPTTVTPALNSPAGSFQSWLNITTTYPGSVIHSTPPNLNLQGSYQTQTICLPASYAGTTRRIVFMWSNDGSVGTQPPGSVDEISLISSLPPATPAAQPTALVLTPFSTSQINGSFTAAAPPATGYLVVRYPAGGTPVAPADGTVYTVGGTLGTGTIISSGPSTTFSTTFLSGGTTYDFYVYAFNGNQCSGPFYRVTTPLFASGATQSCASLAPGTYSVGPTGTYTTLGAALAAAGNGTSGNVIFELQSTYTSAGETFPLTFAATPCPVVGNITVRPAAGATGLVITSSNTTATLDFNGGDKFIIDGRPGGVGTTSQLSVVNTAATGVAVRFINDAQNNTLTYLDIQGQNTAAPTTGVVTSAGVVYFSTAFVNPAFTSLGNDNNTISNSSIHGTPGNTPAVGIFGIGTTTSNAAYNDSITITNNNIYDFFIAGGASSGMKVDAGNNAWTISGNSFYQTASRTTTASNTHRAIWITPNTGSIAATASGFIVTGNFIGGSAASAGGTPLTMTGAFANVFQAIDLSVGFGTPTSAQNNTIRNLAISTTSGAGFIGIGQANGHVSMTGNTIGSQTSTGDITVTTTLTGGGIVIGYRTGGGTGATVNITNNTFGGVTTVGTATLGMSIQGITVAGATTINITNNTVGSPTTANSVNASAATTGNNQAVTGISVTTGTTTLINGNTIANLNNNYTGTSTTGQTRGIVVTGSSTSITNNTVRNLTNAATQVGTASAAAVIGIVSTTGSLPASVVSGNTVHSLTATGTSTTAQVWVTGIYYAGTSTVQGTIAKNFVHSLDVLAANPAAIINGIDFGGGTTTISNNMVRLGIKADGTSITNAQLIRGILSGSTSAVNNFYHNSVYIGGTGVGTTVNHTYAFLRTATSGTYDIRNNIFVNNRSLATTGGKHYAVNFSTNMTGVSIDYNVYQYTGTGGVFAWNGTADVLTYTAGWFASDVHSFVGDPLFANATGTAAAVDLHITAGSIAEGTGIAIASVTDDIDGQVRSGLTPTDIGADAGNYGATGVDVGATLLVSPLAGGCGSATQTVIVRIRNYSANPINFATNPVTVTASATGPVTYNSNIVINTGTLAAGATMDVTLPATINTSAAGTYVFSANTSVTGDANAANDAIGTTNVVVASGASLSGTYTVGAGGNYTTLTAAVAAYNTASCLAGNVIFSLTDPLYNTTSGETFPIRIQHINNPNNYTLTIRPATGVNPNIVTATDSAVIKLNGADNIIIDGSNNATSSRNLTVQNNKTNTQAAGIWVASLGGNGNGATNNVIKNVNVIGGNATQNSLTGIYGIVSSANNSMTTGNSDNDNLTITNNAISKNTVGISAIGTIMSQDGLVINNNVIGSNTATDYVNGIGIGYSYANNALISGNTIFNIITTTGNSNQPSGIDVGTGVIGGSIVSNNISSVYQPSTGGWRANGISFSATGTDGVTVANNMIGDVKTVNYFNPSVFNAFGIYIAGGTNLKFYHNTISMAGSVTTGTGTGFSSNVYITTSAATNMDFRNNILSNTQSFAINLSSIYNIYIATTGFTFGTINYNDYYGASTATTTYRVGYDGTTQRATLNDWRLYTNQDVNSINLQPPFMSATDLHIDVALAAALDNKGTPVGIANDIDGDVRSATTPDVGADEFAVTTGIDLGVRSFVSPTINQCYSNAETFSVRIRNFSATPHNFAVNPVTVNGSVTGPNPQTFAPVVVNTGTLAPGDSLLVTITTTYNMTAVGTYTFSASTTVTGDVIPTNNAMVPVSRVLSAPVAGAVTAVNTQFCLTGTPSLSLVGSNASTIQWQSAPSATGPWTNVGTNSTNYTPAAPITATTYYRAYAVCNILSDTSNVQVVNVNNPLLLTTAPATRCGPGTVTLGATGSAGTSFNWYPAATGGSPLFTGASYTTPIISTTTTYYVSAAIGGSSSTVGMSPTATNCGTIGASGATDWPLRFNTTAPITINSAWVIPQAAGTLTVALRQSLSNTNIQTANFTFTAAQVGVPTQINLGWVISTSGSYQLTNSVGGIYRIGTFTCAYPFTSAGGGFSIVGSATVSTSATNTTTYNSFYNINVSEGCESNRQAVTATVTPAPAFDVTNDLAVCNNATTTLQVNSTLANFDTYVWTPVTGLFTNATATTAYTAGTNASTVYEKIATPGTYTFIAQSNNTTTGCQNFDSVKVTVLPAAITVVPSPDELCVSGTSTITIVPSPSTFGAAQYQWQSSPNNTTYTNIATATGPGYTTPTITATTYYKVDLKNSAGVSCTTAYDTVRVNSPAILSSTPAALCGPGTMTLTATATPGATINWYTTPTGGAPVASNSPFTTPNLTQTTTYYVAATTGSGGVDVGIRVADFAICGFPVTSAATNYPLRFTTTSPVTINTAWVIPSSTSLTVELRTQGATPALVGVPMNFTFTAAQIGQPQQINLGMMVSAPGNYQLTNASGGLWRITTLGCGYPFTTPTGSLSITGSALSLAGAASTTYYNSFYQLNVSQGCESPRVPVVAQVSGITTITQQPTAISTCVGASINLVVGATGANLVYQWRKNGVNIANSNNDTLTFNPVALTDAGTYDVVITGLCGNATSTVMTVNVSAANTWVGAISTDWNTAANWCGGIPTPTTDVAIFSGTPYQPVINATLASARNITINSGASLNMQPNATLAIYGDFVNNGSFVAPNGYVFFKGTANQNISAMTVGNVVVNATGITLTGAMTVSQALVLTNGHITLGLNNLTVTGEVLGTLGSHVITNSTGSVVSRTVGATQVTVPVGPSATSYNPVLIANGSGRDYSVRVSTGLNPTIANPGRAVNRTWNITPSGTGNPSNVSLTFQYDDTHMNTPGVPTNAMEIGVHNGTSWAVAVVSTTPSGTPTARQVGGSMSQFGPMVVTNIGGISWITSAPPPVDPTVSSVMLLPNLVETSAVLRVVSTRTAKIRWNVIDGQGRTVMSFDRSVLQGQNDIPLQLQQLAGGMYHLTGTTDKGITTVVKFVKQ